MATIPTVERQRRIAHRHFLAASAPGVDDVARALVGIHATDPASVYLSARARVAGVSREDVDRVLYDRRSLLRVLGMRRTLFVVPADYEPLLRVGCARRYLEADEMRLVAMLSDQHGHPTEWLSDVSREALRHLEELGTATAAELKEREPRLGTKMTFGEGKKWGGEIGLSTRVLALLAARGEIVRGRPRGSWLSGQYEWAVRSQWVGELPPDPSEEEARRSLVTAWLHSFGPAEFDDLKWWTGWGVRETQTALDGAGAVTVDLENGEAYVLPTDRDGSDAPGEWAALLPSLDATPMGWTKRSWYLGDHGDQLFDRSGNIGPTIWANGRVVGGWGQTRTGEVVSEILEPVTAEEAALIDQEADALAAWLDGEIVKPRFHTPLETRLGLR